MSANQIHVTLPYEDLFEANLSKCCTNLSNNEMLSNSRLHSDVGSLLATHQAVTKHSSGLVIVGIMFSLAEKSCSELMRLSFKQQYLKESMDCISFLFTSGSH